MTRNRSVRVGLRLTFVAASLFASTALARGLEDDLGRSEVRVRSARYPVVMRRTVGECALLERLERLGYRRIHARPTEPGTYFYGHETFWIFRQAHRVGGKDYRESLIGLKLRRKDGQILGAVGGAGEPLELDEVWLEPETLAESLSGDRAHRVLISFGDLPSHVWQAILAAEDDGFFEHAGVEARAIARAALANIKSGDVVQGGSTITQQLIKNRDLTPKRSMGRKASEAVRSLLLEASYSKEEILENYLNQVYLGHVEGLAVHGIGAAARAYFSKAAGELTLAESATLAAMIQGPNRLSPTRHPDRVRERRNWVLSRLAELGWATPADVEDAQRATVRVSLSPPRRTAPAHFMSWVASEVAGALPGRIEAGRGVVVETTLDPYLQQVAEKTVRRRLEHLRRDHRRLRGTPLSGALVSLDARTGEVLAYVGGDPAAQGDAFDRARQARRQPGSAVKPFILLEAFSHCGRREPLNTASRVADDPLTLALPSGEWSPENFDRRYRGVVSAREALAQSRNVPIVRIARWCGFEYNARIFDLLGLELPADPPPSFVLGSVETSVVDLARAYTVMATPGKVLDVFAVGRMEKPEGRKLEKSKPRGRRVVSPETAWLVRDAMVSAVREGTATTGAIERLDVAAKTGSSSELRDAWFAGLAGSLVTVVWIGLDDSRPLGLTGSAAAGPLWREFMQAAVPSRPDPPFERPSGIVEALIDPVSGLRVGDGNRRATKEFFRRGAMPPRARFWRVDRPTSIVH